ncbi:MAG: ABC transporter permease [Kangiellaceae bacterium]|nr:ABC transporter permease [Kangiellaceae bacterium]
MWLVYKKELLELVRDKKTLIFSILLPTIIVPLFMFGFIKFASSKAQEVRDKEIKVAVINAESLPDFSDIFSKEKKFELVTLEDSNYEQAIKDEKVDFVLEIPQTIQAPAQSLKQETVALYYKGSSNLDNIAMRRLESALDIYNKNQRKALGDKFGLSNDNVVAFTKPIAIDKNNFASKREKSGEAIGSFIAYILILLAVSGAMYPALELGVGEKERGTLETLLLTPMKKWQIVVAKFGVIFTTSFLSIVMVLASYFIWSLILGFGAMLKSMGAGDVIESISGMDMFLIGSMLLPVTAIFAALMLIASIYAKNMKEAQAYMSPIMMFAFFPVLIALLPGMELNWKTAMVPITNVSLAMKDLLKGTIDYGLLGMIFFSTLIIAGVLLYFTTQFFKKESVLFRS